MTTLKMSFAKLVRDKAAGRGVGVRVDCGADRVASIAVIGSVGTKVLATARS